jgi:hypothetical protein
VSETGHASSTIPRRIEWIDTDARGIYHWVTVVRYVEAAEALLHDRLGIRQRTFGRTPRVHFTVYVGETDGSEPSPWPDDIRSLLVSTDGDRSSADGTYLG